MLLLTGASGGGCRRRVTSGRWWRLVEAVLSTHGGRRCVLSLGCEVEDGAGLSRVLMCHVSTVRTEPVTDPSPAQTGTGTSRGKKLAPVPVPVAPVPMTGGGLPFPCPSLLWIKDVRDDSQWHSAIQYKHGKQKVKNVECDATWNIDMFNALRNVKASTSLKRSIPDNNKLKPAAKISRVDHTYDSSSLMGLTWNSKDYSCAYDSFFTVLYNIWTDNPRLWSERFKNISEHLSQLSKGFLLVKSETITFETACDTI